MLQKYKAFSQKPYQISEKHLSVKISTPWLSRLPIIGMRRRLFLLLKQVNMYILKNLAVIIHRKANYLWLPGTSTKMYCRWAINDVRIPTL